MTMNAHVTDIVGQNSYASVSRVENFIWANAFERPTLVLDTDVVARQFDDLADGLGNAAIHYAVKANPAPEIIKTLIDKGSRFDAASRAEIELCLNMGANAEDISFGNTVKRPSDIAFAYTVGVTLFAFDAEEELEKLAIHAPGAQVYLRLIVEASEADWPLTRKFGCASTRVLPLLTLARNL
jgi:ornithine decarboxylase